MTTNVIPKANNPYIASNSGGIMNKSSVNKLQFEQIMNQTFATPQAGEAVKNENSISDSDQVKEKKAYHNEASNLDKTAKEDTLIDTKKKEKPDDISSQKVLEKKIENLDLSKFKEILSELSKEMKELLIKSFQISEEELNKAMETLGIGCLDLLNPQNLSSLALSLTESEDMMSLVSNEEICMDYMNLLEEVKELVTATSSSLDLKPEELAQIADMTSQNSQEISTKELSNVIPDEVLEVQSVKEDNTLEAKNKSEYLSEKQIFQASEDVAAVGNTEDIESESDKQTKSLLVESEIHSSTNQDLKTDARTKEAFANEEKSEDHFSNSDPMAENLIGQQGLKDINAQNAKYPEQVIQIEDIIRQIVDSVKVTVREQVSSLELHLNPDNLGKLQIHLTSNEEIVTAKIIAENSAVKEALEGHIAQLRENLSNQGVKVDSIEVTVESHAFESNLNQGSAGQNGSEQPGSQTRRQINLANFMDDYSDFSEEETLAANIMLQNGNKVDYTA